MLDQSVTILAADRALISRGSRADAARAAAWCSHQAHLRRGQHAGLQVSLPDLHGRKSGVRTLSWQVAYLLCQGTSARAQPVAQLQITLTDRPLCV
jgi:hypothetical protein